VERTGNIKTIGWCGRPEFPSKRFSMAVEIASSVNISITNASEKGWKSRDEIKKWYQTIDILLVTSGPDDWCETGPLPAFEAIASGVLVIGTKVGNFACTPGPKFSTVEEGVQILNDLKRNPKKVKQIARQQYECVMELWTYEKNASQWKSLFNIGLEKARSSFQN